MNTIQFEETIVYLEDGLIDEAHATYKAIVNAGYFWNLAMSQEYTYAGIRRRPLSNTLVLACVEANALSKAVLQAKDMLDEALEKANDDL